MREKYGFLEVLKALKWRVEIFDIIYTIEHKIV
jgi:hypothetical protein